MAFGRICRVACLLFTLIIACQQAVCSQPEEVFDKYLQAMIDKRWNDAENCWLPLVISASKRLGITFTDVRAKYDCASPVHKYLEAIRDGIAEAKVVDISRHDDWAQLTVQLASHSDSLSVTYYAVESDDGWRLAAPIYLFTKGWRKQHTQYATIYYNDSSKINRHAYDALDRFVESQGRKLGLSDDDLALLESRKIDYFLCNEDEIKKLTGYDTRGMGEFQYDAVITRHLPHEHELVHLLVNYALKKLPLYTLPFMQEGSACYLGGRWGRSREVIMYTGYINLAYDFCQMEDILTYNDFHATIGIPDVSYPISALFVGYLIEKAGTVKFMELYLNLSGTDREIQSFDLAYIKKTIEEVCGLPWAEIEKGFEDYRKQYSHSGIKPAEISPEGNPDIEISGEGSVVSVWDLGGKYHFDIQLSPDVKGGTVLFDDSSYNQDAAYRGALFVEHHPQEKYNGEWFGLCFSPEEIGLYDYLCDKLQAKYIPSLSPHGDLLNPETGMLRFVLEKSAVVPADLKKLSGRIVKR